MIYSSAALTCLKDKTAEAAELYQLCHGIFNMKIWSKYDSYLDICLKSITKKRCKHMRYIANLMIFVAIISGPLFCVGCYGLSYVCKGICLRLCGVVPWTDRVDRASVPNNNNNNNTKGNEEIDL
ncbi:MAG: hypothetical protein MHMPM18_000542 [Marteilia pararefringens]